MKPNMRTLRSENHEEWEKLFVKTPLGKRERKVLAELGDHGIDDPMDVDLFTEFGHNTAHRLWLRGLIDFKPDTNGSPAPAAVWLTEAGKIAFKGLKRDPEGH